MEAKSIIERSDGGPVLEGGDREDLRERLRGMWAAVAPRWAEHAAYADARGAEVADST